MERKRPRVIARQERAASGPGDDEHEPVVHSPAGRSEEAAVKKIASPTLERQPRVPPGQVLTRKFPVYDIAPRPRIRLDAYRFTITGHVERPVVLTWEEFVSLPKVEVVADFHCVTGWSKQALNWRGVPTSAVYGLVRPREGARYVMVHCLDGYSTNLRLEDFLAEDCLFAHMLDGRPLAPEHGWPLRLIVPRLYAWKSAKYVCGIELMDEERAGFWESRGYHMRGDPWREERFWNDGMRAWEIRRKRR